MTWTKVAETGIWNSVRRMTVFRALSASPGSGTLTLDFGGQVQSWCGWQVDEFDGVDTSGTNGSGAIRQAGVTADGATLAPPFTPSGIPTDRLIVSAMRDTNVGFNNGAVSWLLSAGPDAGNSGQIRASAFYTSEAYGDNGPSTTIFVSGALLVGIYLELKGVTDGSAHYLGDGIPGYSPPTLRGAWDALGSALVRPLLSSKPGGGLRTAIAVAETSTTNNWDVLLYVGVSPPLAAQTIDGHLQAMYSGLESNASANFFAHLHAWVTVGDSDSVRGTLLTDHIDGSEWPTAAAGIALSAPAALSSVSAQDGDRLVLAVGYQAQNTVATSFTGTLRYGTHSAVTGAVNPDLALGVTGADTVPFFVFSQAVTLQAVTPALRHSQVAREVVYSSAAVAVRYSQVAREVVYVGGSGARPWLYRPHTTTLTRGRPS